MTNERQPEALRLAKILEDHYFYGDTSEAAAELRRLHAETINQQDWFVEWKKCEQQVMGLSRLHAEQIGDIVALKEQRDALLEALRKLHHALDECAMMHDDQRSAYANASAIIAKATGETK